MKSLKEIAKELSQTLNSTHGKNALTFLAFLGVSAIFWLVLTLNDEYQRDLKLPIEIVEIPDSVTLMTPPPTYINVSVRDKGSMLAKFQWGEISPVKIKFSDFTKTDNRLVLTQAQVSALIRQNFGSGAQILSTNPDSISIVYTSLPGIKVPVEIGDNINAIARPGYAVVAHPYLIPDSVMLYSTSEVPRKQHILQPNAVDLSDLSDTTRVQVSLKVPQGMKAVPEKVTVVVPVEQLVQRSRDVPVKVVNTPRHQRVTPTPGTVRVVYLIPTSKIALDDYTISVTADYSQSDTTLGQPQMPLSISPLPNFYLSPKIYRVGDETNTIEYIDYVLEE